MIDRVCSLLGATDNWGMGRWSSPVYAVSGSFTFQICVKTMSVRSSFTVIIRSTIE